MIVHPEPRATDRALPLWILAGALLLGAVADQLVRAEPWGLNLTAGTTLLVVIGAVLVRRSGLPVSTEARWLAVTVLLLGAAFARRASQTLANFDLLALVVTLGLTAATLRGVRLSRLNIEDQVREVFFTGLYSIGGVFPLLGRVLRSAQGAGFTRARAVVLGLVIATPLVLAFGILFASADPVFGNALEHAFIVNPFTVASHAFLITLFGALSAGYLSWTVLQSRSLSLRTPALLGTPLGAVPVLTALGAMVGLFGVFVAFQAGELFGGAALVARAAGPSYAEYARHGFFELLVVAGLLLPVLIVSDLALGRHQGAGGAWFRALARTLLVLLFIIILSALNRMRLYVAAYGLSEIRVYATAAMAYIAFLASWLGVRLVRRRRRRFAPGALVAGYVTLTALHVINPDALIVRVNLSRPATTQAFDAAYATSLSADAIPALVEGLPRLDPATRCRVELGLRKRWSKPRAPDWRSLNWARLNEARIAREMASFPDLSTCAAPEAT